MKNLYKALSSKEQYILYTKIQEGDADARDQVIHSCLPLVVNIANKFRYNNKHIDLEDMIQEGNIALIRAVEKWDVAKGAITTVVTWYVRNALINMITDAQYCIKFPYAMSRRASEQLRKIKNLDSNNIEYIAKETGLSKKRIKQLLNVSPKGSSRFSIEEGATEKYTDLDAKPFNPCIGDLIDLIDQNLDDTQKTIFCQWAGVNRKKIGKKQIAESLGKTEQYVYDNIKSATRILSSAAKVLQNA